jgi:hypothetical protein
MTSSRIVLLLLLRSFVFGTVGLSCGRYKDVPELIPVRERELDISAGTLHSAQKLSRAVCLIPINMDDIAFH